MYNLANQKMMVPREPASIIPNARPIPTEDAQTVEVAPQSGPRPAVTQEGPHVTSLIGKTGPSSATPPFTVKVVEQPIRSTYPDTGLANTQISTTRNLDYLKEPTTNRLARGIRGNTDTSDPRVSGIVFEKMENRKAGQLEIPTASGKNWSEPKIPWQAIYPYNHSQATRLHHPPRF